MMLRALMIADAVVNLRHDVVQVGDVVGLIQTREDLDGACEMVEGVGVVAARYERGGELPVEICAQRGVLLRNGRKQRAKFRFRFVVAPFPEPGRGGVEAYLVCERTLAQRELARRVVQNLLGLGHLPLVPGAPPIAASHMSARERIALRATCTIDGGNRVV